MKPRVVVDCTWAAQIKKCSALRNPKGRHILICHYIVWNPRTRGTLGKNKVPLIRCVLTKTFSASFNSFTSNVNVYIFYINSERTLSHWRIFQLHTLMYKIVNFWHTWIIISNIHRNYPSCDVNSRRRSVPSWRKQVDVWSLHQAVYYRVLARESRVPAGLQVHQIPPQAYAARTVRNRRDNEFWVNV